MLIMTGNGFDIKPIVEIKAKIVQDVQNLALKTLNKCHDGA